MQRLHCIWAKQQAVRQWREEHARDTGADAAIALVAFDVLPDGTIKTTELNVSPEQVPALLCAFEDSAESLRVHARFHNPALNAPPIGPNVVPLRRPRKGPA